MDYTQQFTCPVELSIDGHPYITGKLTHARETVYVRSEHAVRPDLRWSQMDPAGHVHRFTEIGDIPTATRTLRAMPCDGTCDNSCDGEGYTADVWHCQECGAEITPKYEPDWTARTFGVPVPGPSQWIIEVEPEVDPVILGLARVNPDTSLTMTPNDGTPLDVVVRGLPDGVDRGGRFVIGEQRWTISPGVPGPRWAGTLWSSGEVKPLTAAAVGS